MLIRRTLRREQDTSQPSSTDFSAAMPICHSPQLGRSTEQPGSLDFQSRFSGGAIRTARLVIRGESAADVTACLGHPQKERMRTSAGHACRGVKCRPSVLCQAARRGAAVPAGAIGSDGSSTEDAGYPPPSVEKRVGDVIGSAGFPAEDAGYPAPGAERRGGGRPQRMRPAKVPRLAGQGRPVYRAKTVKARASGKGECTMVRAVRLHPGRGLAPRLNSNCIRR